jgi:molybdate transport system permease protein
MKWVESWNSIRRLLLILSLLILSACTVQDEEYEAQSLVIAAAANFEPVLAEAGERFTQDTGIPVTFVYGASGILSKQLAEGAPYDAFFSADSRYLKQLQEKNKLVPEIPFVLHGTLVLMRQDLHQPVEQVEDLLTLLAEDQLRFLALPNPEHAPYGHAAVEALQQSGVWSALEAHIVYADNVQQILHYVQSGNAELGFTAKSLLVETDAIYIEVQDALHAPIVHALGIHAETRQEEALDSFVRFLQQEEIQNLFTRYGYTVLDGPVEWRNAGVDRATERQGLLQPLYLSLKIAFWATLLAFFLGVVLAYLFAFYRSKWLNFLSLLVMIPLVLPPTVLGYYLLLLLGQEGWLGRFSEHLFGIPLIFTWKAAVAAAAVAALPLVVKPIQSAFESVDTDVLDAARLDGGRWPSLRWVIMPLAYRGVITGVLLGFARAIGEFGATLMVAGNIPGQTQTLSIAIYDAVQADRMAEANLMVLVLTSVTILLMLIVNKWLSRKE